MDSHSNFAAYSLNQGQNTLSVHERHVNRGGELLSSWLFDQLSLSNEAVKKLKNLYKSGTVVYVTQNQSQLLLLHQLYTLANLGLPTPDWGIGASNILWQPLAHWPRLAELFSSGGSIRRLVKWGFWPSLAMISGYQLLKQQKPLTVCLNSAYQGLQAPWPFFEEFVPLIKAQQEQEQPLFVVPYLLLTAMDPPKENMNLLKRFLGNGFFDTIHDLFNILLPEGDQLARARLGEVLNLKEWLAAQPEDLPLDELCGRLYEDLHQRFLNEERVAVGPRKPKPQEALNFILQDPKVLAAAGITADSSLKERHQYELKVQKLVHEIAANYSGRFLRVFSLFIELIISKLYDEVVIDQAALKKVAAAMAKGPLIICPSHKSHIDYLVASYTFFHAGLTPPHIAAGVNLSFWPLGPIFRRAGAFFIRRSFKGDNFYGAVFKSYVRYLLAGGYSIEFFMEGGRSRTGKLLMPKLGMMNMILEAWRDEGFPEVSVVPISIDYERIVEVSSYTKELAGGEKKPEDIKGLLASGRLLSLRCGRIFLNYGKPINLGEYLAEQCHYLGTDVTPDTLTKDDWRTINKRLSYCTMYNVGQAVTVTPTALLALVMLNQPRHSITKEQLFYRIDFFQKLLYSCKVKFSPLLMGPKEACIEAVIDNLLAEGLLERESHNHTAKKSYYRLSEVAPFELDFYKNNVMQQLAPLAIAACAILKCEAQEKEPSYNNVRDLANFISRLFKNEFLFAQTPDDMANLDVALTCLGIHGIIDPSDEQLKIIRKEQLKWLAGTLDSFIEAYFVVISDMAELRRFPLWQGEFSKHCLTECRGRFTVGQITKVEAASKILINNAINWLLDRGYLDKKESTENAPGRQQLIVAVDEATEANLLTTIKGLLPNERKN